MLSDFGPKHEIYMQKTTLFSFTFQRRLKLFLLQIKTEHFSCNTQFYIILLHFLEHDYHLNNKSSISRFTHALLRRQ